MKYKAIRDGINAAEKKSFHWIAELDELKLIVFSDHHRGSRDGADDFLPCEDTYLRALQYYLENQFTLVLLGDVEEFWENEPAVVMKSYQNVLNLEREFHLRNRLFRIWGNHDDLWQFPDQVKAFFGKNFKGLQVFEAIQLEIQNKGAFLGKILFLHGHQGTIFSAKLAGLSKFFVQFFWRPIQRLFKIPLSTPSKDKKLRYKTDRAMDFWASIRNKYLIVSGHTHQYIFGSYAIEDQDAKPCYFNTGCCSYGNGNISGLEISNNKIRLIEWTKHDNEPYYFAKADLSEIFQRCSSDS